jgi:hypothetical protein
MHEGHWNVEGNPNSQLDFTDPNGNHIATSHPQPRKQPIPTKQGRHRTHLEQLTHTRTNKLRPAA